LVGNYAGAGAIPTIGALKKRACLFRSSIVFICTCAVLLIFYASAPRPNSPDQPANIVVIQPPAPPRPAESAYIKLEVDLLSRSPSPCVAAETISDITDAGLIQLGVNICKLSASSNYICLSAPQVGHNYNMMCGFNNTVMMNMYINIDTAVHEPLRIRQKLFPDDAIAVRKSYLSITVTYDSPYTQERHAHTFEEDDAICIFSVYELMKCLN
jgi:hypothetical protein